MSEALPPGDFKFRDMKGREWDLKLTLGIAKRIDKADFKTNGYYTRDFSFIRPEREFLGALVSDSSFLVAMVWVLVLPQAKALFRNHQFLREDPALEPHEHDSWFDAHLEDAELEFIEAIDGETLEAMQAAFWRSLTDFFREQKTVLSMLLKQRELAIAKLNHKILDQEEFFQGTIDKALERDMVTLRERLLSDLNIQQ